MEHAAKKSHESNGPGNFDGYEQKTDSTEFQNVAEQVACTEQHDAGFQPEFVRGDTGTKDFRNADGVGNQKSEKNSPEDVLDIRKDPMMRLRISAHVLLKQFARVADGCEQKHARNDSKKAERWLHRLNLRNYDRVCHVFSFFSFAFCLPTDHHGICLNTPARTRSAASNATTTAQLSSDRRHGFFTCTSLCSALIWFSPD